MDERPRRPSGVAAGAPVSSPAAVPAREVQRTMFGTHTTGHNTADTRTRAGDSRLRMVQPCRIIGPIAIYRTGDRCARAGETRKSPAMSSAMTTLPTTMPALPLSRWSLLATQDLHRAREHLGRFFRPHRVTPGSLDAGIAFHHNRTDLGGMSLNALSYGSEVTIHAPSPSDSYLVKFTLRGASEVRQGRDSFTTAADSVCVLNPSRDLVDHMSDDFAMLILQIDGPVLRLALAEDFGITARRPLEFLPTQRPLDGAVGSFARLVRTLCEDLDAGTTALNHPQVRAPLVRTLTNLALTELPHNYSARLPRGDATPAPRCVRAVEDYIDAHLDETVSLDDLLVVAGTSARTLQTGFLRYRGTTPMRCLRDRRLDRARAAILRQPSAPITDIAAESGFTHLGRFAQQYRERFGEAPSQTQRSTRGR